jgi:hypothetical protein
MHVAKYHKPSQVGSTCDLRSSKRCEHDCLQKGVCTAIYERNRQSIREKTAAAMLKRKGS